MTESNNQTEMSNSVEKGSSSTATAEVVLSGSPESLNPLPAASESPAVVPAAEAAPKASEAPPVVAKSETPVAETTLPAFSPAKKPKTTEPEAPVVEEDEDSDALKRLLSDPDRYEEDLIEKAVERIESRGAQREAQTAQWDGFFKENPDLAKHRTLVGALARDLERELVSSKRELSFEEGIKEVATKARSLITSIRSDNFETVDTEAASKTAVVSSSGIPAPVQVKEPAKGKSFTEQLGAFQRKKGVAS